MKVFKQRELPKSTDLGAVAALIAALFAGSAVMTPLYVIYEHNFGFSPFLLTVVYAVYVFGNLGALILFGGISDRVGRRSAAFVSLGLAIGSGAAFLVARNIEWLFAGRILSGLAVGIGAGAGTAWIAELYGEKGKTRAAALATGSNFIGLGLGALAAGWLADYTPMPLLLTFAGLIAVLLIVTALVWATPETVVRRPASVKAGIHFKISVPAEIRAAFIAPAIAGFGAMSLVGLYAALAPSILVEQLGISSHLAAGLLFFELAVVVAAVIVGTTWLSSKATMFWALICMVPSVCMLTAAQVLGSLPVMIVATAACGVAAGLGYRGGLQVINAIAPPDHRAEVISAFLICCFLGNALPVMGIGLLSMIAGPIVASLAFAGMVILFALAAIASELGSAKRARD